MKTLHISQRTAQLAATLVLGLAATIAAAESGRDVSGYTRDAQSPASPVQQPTTLTRHVRDGYVTIPADGQAPAYEQARFEGGRSRIYDSRIYDESNRLNP